MHKSYLIFRFNYEQNIAESNEPVQLFNIKGAHCVHGPQDGNEVSSDSGLGSGFLRVLGFLLLLITSYLQLMTHYGRKSDDKRNYYT